MQAWQHRWETWAGRNLGFERWDFAFGVGQAKRLSRSDHALSDSATKLADGSPPDRNPSWTRRQINSDLRKSCQAPKEKIFRFLFRQIRIISFPSHPRGGALAIATKRWDEMRWTRAASGAFAPDEALFAYGEVVWSWRRDAGAKPVGRSAGDGGKQAVHRGEHEVSRKAIAQGMPECLRFTCMLVCVFVCARCTRDRGCSAHPAFPAPSV
jgi:hypothetical protein